MVDCQIQPIMIRGSVEDRINKIVRLQNWLHEGMYLYTSDMEPASQIVDDTPDEEVEITEESTEESAE